jgi:formylglycine-generating enzyme required for sulfatase activity
MSLSPTRGASHQENEAMSRYDYGRVRGGRRSSRAVWQWLIIGLVIGFSCAAVLLLAGLTLGFLSIDPEGVGLAARPTQTAFVVTATPDPNATTPAPVVVTATTDPAVAAAQEATATQAALLAAGQGAQITLPTATLASVETAATEGGAAATATLATDPVAGGGATATTATTTGAATTTGTTTTGGASGALSSTVPGQVPPELASLISPLVVVEGGTFNMGTTGEEVAAAVRLCTDLGGQCLTQYGEDAIPQRPTTINTFQIERTEVSYAQYIAFLNYLVRIGRNHSNGCGTETAPQKCADTNNEAPNVSNIFYDTANYTPRLVAQNELPVMNVTWYGAEAYCRAIGRRLPTEAEWERAARGRSNFIYPWGNEWNPDLANTNRSTNATNQPLPATSFQNTPSEFGALNMAGNVAEWVFDWYNENYYDDPTTVNNPQGPAFGIEKVVRGGSYVNQPFFARTMHRLSAVPSNTINSDIVIGFRCAADFDPNAAASAAGALPVIGATTPLPPLEGTLDPLELGRIDPGGAGGSAPALPTLPQIVPTTQP